MLRGIKFFLFTALLSGTLVSAEIRAQNDESRTENPPIKLPESRDVPDPDSLIHSGDLIEVDVLGSTEFDWRGNVSPEGFLGGLSFTKEPIYALCESEENIAQKISAEYKSFLNNPRIVVRILDRSNRPITRLFGAVNSPQRFKIKREVFLNELIVIAGGITEKASGDIRILRSVDASCAGRFEGKSIDRTAENGLPDSSPDEFVKISDSPRSQILTIKISDILKGSSESNPRILYGDIITVLEAESVYVMGAVENPSRLSLRSDLTVTRAIDSSGGLAKGAEERNITLFRRNGNGTEVIRIDLAEIASGSSEDPVLQPFDIIDVPGKGGRGSKYPPVIQQEAAESIVKDPPLRIID
ncbi:MAG: SLBB domain-containing protein [Pyrinomonadaceae bacterium]